MSTNFICGLLKTLACILNSGRLRWYRSDESIAVKSCESHCFRPKADTHIGIRGSAHEAAIGHEMVSWCMRPRNSKSTSSPSRKLRRSPRYRSNSAIASVVPHYSHCGVSGTDPTEHPPGRNFVDRCMSGSSDRRRTCWCNSNTGTQLYCRRCRCSERHKCIHI